jgi:hypothetical protein
VIYLSHILHYFAIAILVQIKRLFSAIHNKKFSTKFCYSQQQDPICFCYYS